MGYVVESLFNRGTAGCDLRNSTPTNRDIIVKQKVFHLAFVLRFH